MYPHTYHQNNSVIRNYRTNLIVKKLWVKLFLIHTRGPEVPKIACSPRRAYAPNPYVKPDVNLIQLPTFTEQYPMLFPPLFNGQHRFRVDHIVTDISFQHRFNDLFTVFLEVFCLAVQVGYGNDVLAAFGSAWVALFEPCVFLYRIVNCP